MKVPEKNITYASIIFILSIVIVILFSDASIKKEQQYQTTCEAKGLEQKHFEYQVQDKTFKIWCK